MADLMKEAVVVLVAVVDLAVAATLVSSSRAWSLL
jgi:hypothetical protein